MIWIQNQLIGAFIGQSLTLECLSEAHPKSINYWTREAGEIIAHGKQAEHVRRINAAAADGKSRIRPWCGEWVAKKKRANDDGGIYTDVARVEGWVNELKIQQDFL